MRSSSIVSPLDYMAFLTMVFTDVVGSSVTKRDSSLGRDDAERDKTYLEKVQAPHFALVRKSCLDHGGKEVSNSGDAFFLTFENPMQAVRAAVDIQQRLASQPIATPTGQLRLRIGIHSGFPERFEDSWHGTDVDIVARIESVAIPGQILISSRAYELVNKMSDANFKAHGDQELKGVGRLKLWEVCWENRQGNAAMRKARDYAPFAAGALFLLLTLGALLKGPEAWRRLFPSTIPAQKNLVVLPFTAVDTSANEQVYCDGFTETVTAKLAHVRALHVAPAVEVRNYHVSSVQEAKSRFGANLVLAASWQRVGNSARINLSLVDTRSGKQLRTETITEPANDLFRLQDQVVLKASRMLELQFSPSNVSALTTHGTTVLTAFDFYMQGIGYLQRYERSENVGTAISLFQRALEQDHSYAQAHASLAQAYWYKYSATRDPQWADAAKAAVQAARKLNSQLPEVQLAVAAASQRTGAYEEAISEFHRVLDVDADNVDAYLGLGGSYDALGLTTAAEQSFRQAIDISPQCWSCYNLLGAFLSRHARYSEAAEAWQRVTQLVPDNVWGYLNVGALYLYIGQFTRAEVYFRRGLELAPDNPDLYSNAGTASFFQGRFEEDVTYSKKAIDLRPQDYDNWGNLGDAYRMIPGKSSEAAAAYMRSIQLAEAELKVNPNDTEVFSSLALHYARVNNPVRARQYFEKASKAKPESNVDFLLNASLVYLELGDRREAIAWLEKAVAAGYAKEHLLANPELVALHSEPQFNRLVHLANSYQ